MTYLGDYIGHILSEITLARAQADGETIRLAELYADHELLKHFPVPRIRLQETQLDIAVLVINSGDSGGDSGPRGGPSPEDTALVFDAVIAKHIVSLRLTTVQQNQIRGALARQYQLLRKRRSSGLDAGGLSDRLTRILAVELAKLKVPPRDSSRLLTVVRAEAREELQLKAVSPARIQVGVKSSELRDADPESVLRISMKIGEEAVEWSVLDQEGDDPGKQILTPE